MSDTITLPRATVRQALEAWEHINKYGFVLADYEGPMEQAITALKAALEQPEPRNQCGETCERAKLCAVCAKGLEQPAQEQEPVADRAAFERWYAETWGDGSNWVGAESELVWLAYLEATRAALAEPVEEPEQGGKTGWPPGLLQDDCRGLSKWLASQPDARRRVREAVAALEQPERPNLLGWSFHRNSDGSIGIQRFSSWEIAEAFFAGYLKCELAYKAGGKK